MNFTQQMEAFAKQTSVTLDQATRAVKLQLFSDVIENTRVKWGRAKGNWQTTTGAPAAGTLDRLDPNGTQAKAEAATNVTAQGTDYMTNNLPYIGKLEGLDGMVDKGIARIQRTVEEVARASR